ncbi:MAG: lipid A export permease/ATP-binding protein MsbA [Desulfocapsa sp.]|uniref:Lipid A export permease/ATP-binding protein MsbA n=1 Tax=Desulfotalea psychrophila TaxID=84980 RepID=A0ABS3AXV0_9BACT|nr:lipid A export permease/ATP-binding protein MsbA [Desulfocapsa sp.]MBN4068831.1 lipid A export permease/ATP-binding protein MsbA [Desulfotalea psychrophila]
MTNKEIVARLFEVLKPYRNKLVIAMVGMMIVAGFNAAQAYMVKPLLDEIFVNKDRNLLNILPLALLAIFLIKGVFYFIYSYLLEGVGQYVIRDLRNQIYAHLNRLSLSFFHRTPTGELISRIMNDVSLLQGAVSHALIRIIRDFVSVIGLLGVVFYMDWRLAGISMIFLPMAAIPVVVFGKKFRRVSTRFQKSMGEATNILHETIGGARIVKAFCTEKQEEKRFAAQIQHLFDTLMKETKYRCLSHPMIEFMGGVGIALIVWFGGIQVLNGTSTIGTFMAFLTALVMLYEPVKGVTKINSTIQSGLASATRIFNLLDIAPDIIEKSDAEVLPPFHKSVEFRNVTFFYEHDEPVLQNVNLTVRRGEILAVVGPSGGGKTTLANLLPRFYDVASGVLLIDGHDVRDVTLASLRSQMALVTQQTILFNDTVRNNIAYGSQHCSDEDIRRAAEAAFALEFIEKLPDGFETIIGESGARLSGGQRQRISIARAVLKDAPILVLDEATSALDTESERKVQNALENLMKNRTTIVIAHRLSTIKNADRIIVMQDGKLVEEGSHEQLLKVNGIYEGLYTLQYSQ